MSPNPSAAGASLLACLRDTTGVRQLDPEASAHLLAQATRHQVLPALGQLAAAGKLALAAEPSTQLHEQLRVNAQRTLAATAVLIRVHALLQEQGIDMLALKGITLAQHIHGDSSLRQAGDLDLLIAPAQLEPADRALRKAGLERFIPAADPSPSQQRLYTALRHEYAYRDPAYDLRVELHWRLNNCAALTPGPFAQLWARRAQVRVGGVDIPTLGADDLLLHLCIHGGTEAWPKLKWLRDIAQLFPRYDDEAAARVLGQARATGLERLLLLGAALAAELLAAPLAPCLQQAIRQDPSLPALLAHARRNLLELRFKPGGGAALGNALADFAYRLRLSRRWNYRLQALAADLVIPETVLHAPYANWPLWLLAPLAAAKTFATRIRNRLGA